MIRTLILGASFWLTGCASTMPRSVEHVRWDHAGVEQPQAEPLSHGSVVFAEPAVSWMLAQGGQAVGFDGSDWAYGRRDEHIGAIWSVQGRATGYYVIQDVSRVHETRSGVHRHGYRAVRIHESGVGR